MFMKLLMPILGCSTLAATTTGMITSRKLNKKIKRLEYINDAQAKCITKFTSVQNDLKSYENKTDVYASVIKSFNRIIDSDLLADIASLHSSEKKNKCLHIIEKVKSELLSELDKCTSMNIIDNDAIKNSIINIDNFIDEATDLLSYTLHNDDSDDDDIDDVIGVDMSDDGDELTTTIYPSTIIMNCINGPAKVYDTGCAYGTIDIYVNW